MYAIRIYIPIAAYRADNQVCCMVDYFNDHLRLINRNCGTPRISQDIIASRKGVRAERTSYRKNWNVYSDGIHPVRALARLLLFPYLNSTYIYIYWGKASLPNEQV
jgi:hypothetical protein